MQTIINSNKAPKAIGPYSQAICVEAKKMLFVSGQIPLCPESMSIVKQDIEWQTDRVLQNLQAILQEASVSLHEVVKVTIYLTDMSHFVAVNNIYEKFFADHKPTRVCLAVKELPKNSLIEMDAIAVIS